LRLVDPGDAKTFQRFDGIRRVILHAAEDDDAVAGRCDLVAVDSELVAEAQRRDLAFDQPLGGLRQRPLRLANAHRERATLGLAGLDQKLAEKMRFARTATAVHSLVACTLQQRLKYFRGRDFQDGQ
jgi:hypothetical protein